MAITLYDATVPSFLQILAAVRGYLEKSLAHTKQTGGDPEALLETRLYADMWPLRAQIVSVAHHSRGALEAVERGTFSPPSSSEAGFAELQALIAEAEAAVGRFTPAQVNGFEGRDLAFKAGGHTLAFVAED